MPSKRTMIILGVICFLGLGYMGFGAVYWGGVAYYYMTGLTAACCVLWYLNMRYYCKGKDDHVL